MLAGSLWRRHNVVVHKMINRKMLERALKPFPHGSSEKLWTAQLPQVEEGTDMLVYMALMKQRYSEILEALRDTPYIILLGRYIDSVFAHAATRIVLNQIASDRKSANKGPESLSKLLYEESQRKGLIFESFVDKCADDEVRKCRNKIERLYTAFAGLRSIVRWPDLTIVLDIPTSKVRERESRRENRAFTQGDILYFAITTQIYGFLAKREPNRVYMVNGHREREKIAKEILGLVRKKYRISAYRKSRGR